MVNARPAHEPLALRCKKCGAPLSIPDERTLLVLCGNCDTRLELTGPMRDTLRILGGNANREVGFALTIGQSFRWKGARYEVTARLCWIEDNSMAYATRVYVLYHPRRPLLFLDEYHNSWGLTHKVHVMPAAKLRSLKAGAKVRTHDGKKWECVEKVHRKLVFVDGCLPWMAQVGDTVTAWELHGSGGARYEIERSGSEVEYNRGRLLQRKDLERAGLKVKVSKPALPIYKRKRQAGLVAVAGVVALLGHGIMGGVATLMGEVIHQQTLSAEQLTQEATTSAFQITDPGLLRVELTAPLDNAWMALDVALIEGDDTVSYVTDADLSYYHGTEGGESWSEGSRSESLLLSGPKRGEHRLLLRAVSNAGETESATRAQHPLTVTVKQGARSGAAVIPGVLFGLLLIGLGILWLKVLEEEE